MNAETYLAEQKTSCKLNQDNFSAIKDKLAHAQSAIFGNILYSAANSAVEALHKKKIFDISIYDNALSRAIADLNSSITVDINDVEAEDVLYNVSTPCTFQDMYQKGVTKFDRFKKKFFGNRFYRVIFRYEFCIANFTEFIILKKLVKCTQSGPEVLDSSTNRFTDIFNFDLFITYEQIEHYCNKVIPDIIGDLIWTHL